MKITRIYIAGYKYDLRWTQCCVASIRRWYPDIAITLIKDELQGSYDTTALERDWGVSLFECEKNRFGWGMSKLEPLLLPGRERCLVLDSDTVFAGRVLDRLEAFDEDFVVVGRQPRPENVESLYFDVARLKQLDPAFEFDGTTFNTGQIVATTGLFRREDFAPFVDSSDVPALRHPDVFKCGEQGLLNYVLSRRARLGEISVRSDAFMRVPWKLAPGTPSIEQLRSGECEPFVIHWCGGKGPFFAELPAGEILRRFEDAWHERTPPGKRERTRIAAETMLRKSEE